VQGFWAGLLAGKEGENLMPPQLLAEQHHARCIRSVDLEHVLRQI
jgi:hypothetical protein